MSAFTCTSNPKRSKCLRGIILLMLGGLALCGCGGLPSQSPAPPITGHAVTLSWAADPSTVSGYAVYRSSGDPSGPFFPLTITLPGTTQYTDTNVVAGQTYYYTITAFNSSNLQSLPTAAVTVTVPSS